MQIRATIARAPDQPFELVDCEIGEPGAGDVLVRIRAIDEMESGAVIKPVLLMN